MTTTLMTLQIVHGVNQNILSFVITSVADILKEMFRKQLYFLFANRRPNILRKQAQDKKVYPRVLKLFFPLLQQQWYISYLGTTVGLIDTRSSLRLRRSQRR